MALIKLNVFTAFLFGNMVKLREMPRPLAVTGITQHTETLHCVRIKRGHGFFLYNFNNYKHSFVIFGMNHPEDSLY